MPIRALVSAGLAVLLAASVPARAAAPQTDDQKTIYAIGQAMARQLEQFQFTPDEVSMLIAGLQDALTHGKPQVDLEAQSKQIRAFAEKRQAAVVEKEKAGETMVPYSTRHTRITEQFVEGNEHHIVMHDAGHVIPTTTERYKHLAGSHVAETIRRRSQRPSPELKEKKPVCRPRDFASSVSAKSWRIGSKAPSNTAGVERGVRASGDWSTSRTSPKYCVPRSSFSGAGSSSASSLRSLRQRFA